jgi:PEP-CTERM motif-containing protein
MNRFKGVMLGCAFMALPAITQAQAYRTETLTFEGLGDELPIPAGYGGFSWSPYFNTVDVFAHPGLAVSGYMNGLKSGTTVAYACFYCIGEPVAFWSTSPFTFNSVWITPGWNLGETVEVSAWNATSEVYDQTFLADWTNPVFFAPNWSNLYEVEFYGSGGVIDHRIPSPTNSEALVFDNLTVTTATPEPATLLLLGTGLLGLGLASLLRRSA